MSLMAASAGGQTIALLSMCLSNVFLIEDVGLTLSKLSPTFLARSMQIASVAQLAEAARLLSGKLNTIGFGNILAKESGRIHRAYESFGSEAPPDLLYSLDGQSINEMFAPILQSLHEDQTLCRIEGSREMAYIVSMLQVLFPHSLKITVEGIIIQDVQNPKIYIAIWKNDAETPLAVHLESSVLCSGSVTLPIAPHISRGHEMVDLHFKWPAWLADDLKLFWLHFGLILDQTTLDACQNVLSTLPAAIYVSSLFTDAPLIESVSLQSLLGHKSRAQLHETCKEILQTECQPIETTFQAAYQNFIQVFNKTAQRLYSSCGVDEKTGIAHCWLDISTGLAVACELCLFRHGLFESFIQGVHALFVELIQMLPGVAHSG